MTFRKLVTNLPFSPNLIHKVNFYAKRLRGEEITRRVGVIFTILALVAQSAVLISPPQPTMAASGNDIIYGGVNGIGQILNVYDSNRANFKDILTSFGITRQDLQAGHQANIRYYDYNKQLYSMGRYPYGFSTEYAVQIHNGQTYYMRQLASWGNASDTVWQFQSGGHTFMIMYHCGNLVSIGPSYPTKRTVTNGQCTVVTNIKNAIKPGQSFKASFTVTNTSNHSWGVYRGPGSHNPYVLGTLSPLDNNTFGKHRETIPENTNSAYGPLLEAGKTAKWSDTFTAPKKDGVYSFNWRVLQEGKVQQIGQSCGTQIVVKTDTVTNGQCTVITESQDNLNPGQSFKASFTVTNTSNHPWGVYRGPGSHNPYVLGTTNPLDTMQFGKNRETIPGTTDSMYATLLEAGKTVKWSDTFTAPKESGVYPFAWRVLQEGKVQQIGTPCATQVTVVTPTPPPSCPPENKNHQTNCIILSKDVENTTQGIKDANGTTAHADDTLVYTLTAQNTGKEDQKNFIMQDNIGDILEYATISDLKGASLDKKTNIISWPADTIKAGGKLQRSFVVKVKDPIPQTPQSTSNPGSYDLRMTNVYGNTVNIKLTASVPKITEQVIEQLPSTGAGTNIIIECALFMVVTFFYMRSRQLISETDIVKKEFNYSGN